MIYVKKAMIYVKKFSVWTDYAAEWETERPVKPSLTPGGSKKTLVVVTSNWTPAGG